MGDSYSIKKILLFVLIENLLLMTKMPIGSLLYICPIKGILKPHHIRLQNLKILHLIWGNYPINLVQEGQCSWIIKMSLLLNLLTLSPKFKAKLIILITAMTNGKTNLELDPVGSINLGRIIISTLTEISCKKMASSKTLNNSTDKTSINDRITCHQTMFFHKGMEIIENWLKVQLKVWTFWQITNFITLTLIKRTKKTN